MNYIKYLPLTMVCLLILKVLARGCDLPEALVTIGLIGFTAYNGYKEQDKVYQGLSKDIALLRAELVSRNQSVDAMSTKVAAMQVSSGMKTLRNG